ncbi:MAG: hypothetical protein ACREQC_00655, partial [Candidatus Binataceae bacterium]
YRLRGRTRISVSLPFDFASGELARDIRRHHSRTLNWFSGDDHYHMFSASKSIIPARKELGIQVSRAGANLVGVSEGAFKKPSMERKKIRMPFGYVPLAFFTQFDATSQIGTG